MEAIVAQLADTVRTAAAQGQALCIRAGGTKDFYGGPARGATLSLGAYRGIVDYEPTELILTARAGTPLAEIDRTLAEQGQMLAFEPPHFGPATTLGGAIAAGLSGPRRPYAGSARDFVLGVRVIDGGGRDLRFGGQVMKNVAGFDVSRLMAGSLGTLGLLLEISLKVLPRPVAEATLRFELSAADALQRVNQWASLPLPLSATAWHAGMLSVRLSGAGAAVDAAQRKLGGERIDPARAEPYWACVRDHADPFFKSPLPLWRLSVKSTSPPLNLPGVQLIEWGGALRWLASSADAPGVRAAAEYCGGHATLFRGGNKAAGVFHPLPATLLRLHQKLKAALDPAGILNPGRLYSDL